MEDALINSITIKSLIREWESRIIDAGTSRDLVSRILPHLHSPEAVLISGVRRSGKTTLLYQLMQNLVISSKWT